MQELLTELTNYQNALIMFVTWMAIEVLSPVGDAVVMSKALLRWRLRLYAAAKLVKRLAGVAWCSALVWAPYAQPPLCGEGVEPPCQSVFARVALGVILGGLLSSGHWAGAIAYRKLTGREKKVVVKCAACGEKIEVSTLNDPCPKCGKPPHEVTGTRGTF